MSRIPALIAGAATAAAVVAGPSAVRAQPANVTIYTAEAPFDAVRQDLADAIINRGFVIDYEARIGDMLNRTASDVGAERTIYNKADALQFCSATLSRRTMEADPANIAFCPYVLFVYELAGESGKTQVGFRQLAATGSEQSKAALAEVNALLDEIAKEAAGAD